MRTCMCARDLSLPLCVCVRACVRVCVTRSCPWSERASFTGKLAVRATRGDHWAQCDQYCHTRTCGQGLSIAEPIIKPHGITDACLAVVRIKSANVSSENTRTLPLSTSTTNSWSVQQVWWEKCTQHSKVAFHPAHFIRTSRILILVTSNPSTAYQG